MRSHSIKAQSTLRTASNLPYATKAGHPICSMLPTYTAICMEASALRRLLRSVASGSTARLIALQSTRNSTRAASLANGSGRQHRSNSGPAFNVRSTTSSGSAADRTVAPGLNPEQRRAASTPGASSSTRTFRVSGGDSRR